MTTDSDLYDMFVAPGTTYHEVASMGGAEIKRQIDEMRKDEPDNIKMESHTIARRIVNYAVKEMYG